MRIDAVLTLLLLAAAPAHADPSEVVADLSFPEGPIMLDGRLVVAQYAGNMVSVWDGAGLSTLWEAPGCGPSAVAPLGEDLAVTCYDDGTIARIGRDGRDIARYAADSAGTSLVGPNDLAPDGQGGLYVTASGPWESVPIVGKVYHLGADGTLAMVADDLHYANGIALAPGGDRLFVVESEAGRVISFAVGADGTLSNRRLFVRVAVLDPASGIGAYPDGIKMGPDGNLWIGQYSSGRIVVVALDGSLVAVHDTGATAAPNLAFSENGDTAFVMAVDDVSAAPYAGRILALPLD